MADITNAEAVRFSNDKIRVAADKLAQAFYFADLVVNEWNANDMASLISNKSLDTLIDGSADDGRHVITGADATNIVTRCQELIADYEASGNAKLNTILGVAVNTGE